jgi:hypothetical protein
MSRRTAIAGKLLGRVFVTGLAASLAFMTAAVGTAHALPPDPPEPPPSGTIGGSVRLTDCNVSPTNVVIRVAEKLHRFDNLIKPSANGTLTVEVPRGEYTITPLTKPCPAGRWSPPASTVQVLAGSKVTVNFRYEMPTKTATFTPTELADAVQSQLARAALRVNGFAPGISLDHSKPNDSILTIGDLPTFKFTAPRHHKTLQSCHLGLCIPLGDANWYVNDIRLDHATTSFDHGWTVNAFFESLGRELKGFYKSPIPFTPEVDNLMPDINVDFGVATVRIVPIVSDGALTYDVKSSSFDAQIQATGPCNLTTGFGSIDVCDEIASYKQSVKTQFAGHVAAALNSDTARAAINLTIAQQVSSRGLSRVDTIGFDPAGNLILGQF